MRNRTLLCIPFLPIRARQRGSGLKFLREGTLASYGVNNAPRRVKLLLLDVSPRSRQASHGEAAKVHIQEIFIHLETSPLLRATHNAALSETAPATSTHTDTNNAIWSNDDKQVERLLC